MVVCDGRALPVIGVESMSPSVASQGSDQGVIDLNHLRDMTMSDVAMRREVLGLIVVQSANIIAELAPLPANAAALAHTLKGSARAIGAFRVADAASLVENTARSGGDIPKTAASDVLAALSREIDLACTEIANILRGQ
jgi:HPt (histidine-containing phosphotransfer) domain-containing protein